MQRQESNIRNETAEIANFYFANYKSLQTESCHSNQSSYQTEKRNIFTASEEKIFFTIFFSRKFALLGALATNQSKGLG